MLKVLSDLINDFRETAKERIRNPFLSTFIVFLLVTNWKVVLLFFFGDSSIPERIEQIKNEKLCFWDAVALPLMESAIFVLVIPWVSFLVQKWQLIPIKKSSRNKIDHQKDMANKRNALLEKEAENDRIRFSLTDKFKEFGIEKVAMQLKITELTGERNKVILDLKNANDLFASMEITSRHRQDSNDVLKRENDHLIQRISSLQTLLDKERHPK